MGGHAPTPLRVLHRGGNARAAIALARARRSAVDAIEADVWVRSGEAVAHHARPLGPLPLTIGRRGLRPRPRDPVRLGELLRATAAGGGGADAPGLMLDLRSWFGDPAPDLARALLPLPHRERLRLSCESWTIAERLRAWLPDVPVACSIRTEDQLRRFFAGRMAGRLPPGGVSVRHSLLHGEPEARSLRRRAGWVAAWTVDDPGRARELAAWGVDAVISNRPRVLAAL